MVRALGDALGSAGVQSLMEWLEAWPGRVALGCGDTVNVMVCPSCSPGRHTALVVFKAGC